MQVSPQKKKEPAYKTKIKNLFAKLKGRLNAPQAKGLVPAPQRPDDGGEEIVELEGDVCAPVDEEWQRNGDGQEEIEVEEIVRLDGDVCMPLNEKDPVQKNK